MDVVNIIKIDVNTIKSCIAQYHKRLNIYPVVICSIDTFTAIKSYENNNKLKDIKDEPYTYFFDNCKVLFDNSLEYGMVEVR